MYLCSNLTFNELNYFSFDQVFYTLIGAYRIDIKDSPNLDYVVVPEYSLSVSCSDQKDSVTEIFTVEVTENKDPEVTNLPGSLKYI